MNFKAVKISDIFYKVDLKGVKITIENKNQHLSKTYSKEFNLPLASSVKGFNGTVYFGRKSEWESTSNAIQIITNGAVSTGDVYYHKNEIGLYHCCYLLKTYEEYTPEHMIYLSCAIKKALTNFSHGYAPSWERVQDLQVMLPCKELPVIDKEKKKRPLVM